MRTAFLRSAFFFSVIPVLFTAHATAGPVTGRVVDPDGRAVPGAIVMALEGAAVAATAVTDSGGRFLLNVPERERLQLRVAIDGFRARAVDLPSASASTDLGTITLEISAVAESLVVSATQVEVPLSTTASSVTIVTASELAARQVETLADALRLVPGLTVAATGSAGAVTGVFPRGGESDYALVFVDGVQANAFGGGFDFAHVPLADVERIEIVRGPQSALYGSNAIGSVIRIVTRRGGPLMAAASFEAGAFGTTAATGTTAGSLGSWHWGASAERRASDGFNGRRAANGEAIVNDDYERTTAAASGGWTRSSGATVRADVRFGVDERGAPGPFGSDPGGTFRGIDALSRGENDRWLSSISAAVPLAGRVRLHAHGAHGRIESRFSSPFGESEASSRRTTGRVQADVALVEGLDASAGAELQRERAASTYITAGPEEIPIRRALLGLFAEARWNRQARLFVTAGVRGERIGRDALRGDPAPFSPRPDFPEDTVVSVNPKIAVAWYARTADGTFTKLRGTAGTGIRPPDGFEIAFTDNPSLKPERSRSVDLGVDQAFFGGRALFEATAFANEYDDLIVAVGSFREASRFRTDNISNARARGLELALSARDRLGRGTPIDVEARFGYTLLHTEILAVDRGGAAPPPFVKGDRLLRRPRHQLAADLLVRGGAVSVFLQAHGRGDVRDVDPSLGTFGALFDAPGFGVWHAGVSWRIVRGVEMFGRVNNLFDRRYEEALGYPAPSRSGFAGLRVAAGR